jgi:hypothetical protein
MRELSPDSLKLVGRSSVSAKDVHDQGAKFVRTLQMKKEAERKRVDAILNSEPIYLRVSAAGRTAARMAEAAGWSRVDSVELHRKSDLTHLHRLEPQPGSLESVRIHDLLVCLSNCVPLESFTRRNR